MRICHAMGFEAPSTCTSHLSPKTSLGQEIRKSCRMKAPVYTSLAELMYNTAVDSKITEQNLVTHRESFSVPSWDASHILFVIAVHSSGILPEDLKCSCTNSFVHFRCVFAKLNLPLSLIPRAHRNWHIASFVHTVSCVVAGKK